MANASRYEWIKTERDAAYIHEVLLHVVGEVLEHCDFADKVFRNLACGEDSALAQLCIVMDGPVKKRKDSVRLEANDSPTLSLLFLA